MNRVETDPEKMAGKPLIKGTRVPIYIILDMLVEGKSFDDIIEAYPDLDEKDIRSAIKYASERVKGEELREPSVA
ncbi:MAG: DUF433 domain-containing protein [Candidatus Nanohaloarchaea archaeon]